jgi:hypothetical protein
VPPHHSSPAAFTHSSPNPAIVTARRHTTGSEIVSPFASDPAQVRLIEKWRLRHAYPDAVGMWAISDAPEARAFAFNAIAQDPRILHRAARPRASKMAAHAEDFALSIAQSDAARSETWLAAALLVQRSIDAWRQTLRAYSRPPDVAGVSTASTIHRERLHDPWEIARRNFPYVDDETGRLTTRILHEFGAAALARVRKPWDRVIVLGILRHAARLLRGELPETRPDFSRERSIDDIVAVQSYAEENHLSPLLVPYSGSGKRAQQALDLMRDAHTLRDAVRDAPSGGPARASIWQRAIDLHAFAVVALDHRTLLNLPLDEAYQLADAAIRHVETAKQSPDVTEMPMLPPGFPLNPEVVALHARACLPAKAGDAPA